MVLNQLGGLSPTIKIQKMNQFVILSFGVDPLNWQSFTEIGEIACSTPAWCTHGLTLKSYSMENKWRTIADNNNSKIIIREKQQNITFCTDPQKAMLIEVGQ